MNSRLMKIAIRVGASLAACGLFALSSTAVADKRQVTYCMKHPKKPGCDVLLRNYPHFMRQRER